MNVSAKNAQLAATAENDPRWPSVVARDPAADGTFYYSVKTTGVYCRPSCAARLARPENVRFHTTLEDAEMAGFRPCKRCKPNQSTLVGQHAAKVTEACRLIEESENVLSLEDLAKHVGVSTYHFHRVFKKVTGLTPRAYAAAHRAKRLRAELARRGTVTEAIYGAGYNSNGRFYEKSNQLLGMTLRIIAPVAPIRRYASPSASAPSGLSSSLKASAVFVPFSSAMIPTNWRAIYKTGSREPR